MPRWQHSSCSSDQLPLARAYPRFPKTERIKVKHKWKRRIMRGGRNENSNRFRFSSLSFLFRNLVEQHLSLNLNCSDFYPEFLSSRRLVEQFHLSQKFELERIFLVGGERASRSPPTTVLPHNRAAAPNPTAVRENSKTDGRLIHASRRGTRMGLIAFCVSFVDRLFMAGRKKCGIEKTLRKK